MSIYGEPISIYSIDRTSGEVELLVGIVRCGSNYSPSYATIRKAIESCGLLNYQFQFLNGDKSIQETQEGHYNVDNESCVFLRKRRVVQRSESAGSNCFMLGIKSETVCAEDDYNSECESKDRSKEFLKAEDNLFNVRGSSSSHLRSKLISQKGLCCWLSWIKKKKKELQEKGRQDEFDLWTADEGNEVRIKVWCEDCRETYGKGAADKARETLNNFCRTHLECKAHKENQKRRLSSAIQKSNHRIYEEPKKELEQQRPPTAKRKAKSEPSSSQEEVKNVRRRTSLPRI